MLERYYESRDAAKRPKEERIQHRSTDPHASFFFLSPPLLCPLLQQPPLQLLQERARGASPPCQGHHQANEPRHEMGPSVPQFEAQSPSLEELD